MGLVDRANARDGDAGAPGVCLTLAWQIGAPILAFEGNIRSAGSTLIWAAELLGVTTQELADLAATMPELARRATGSRVRGSRRAVVRRFGVGDGHRLRFRRHACALRPGGARIRSPIKSPTSSTPCAPAARRLIGSWSTADRPATTN